MKKRELTQQIIKCFYKVYNTLGFGFLESVYEKALLLELKEEGLQCTNQFPINVFYNHVKVGIYYADIVVENDVILELKAERTIAREHELQLINYLKATEMEVGLLLNFGGKPEFKRKVFSNSRKLI